MPNTSTFQKVKSRSPGKSVFDLSYTHKTTGDLGQLIPILCEEAVPGDNFKIGNQVIIRFQPLLAPILHEVNVYVHYFFCPYRKLWDNSKTDSWEAFITGGIDGDLEPVLPKWTPTINTVGSLWDHLGYPIGISPQGAYPMTFPRDSYNWIYNEYYRDETITPEVLLTQEAILNRLWEKDYFASSLPWQQRGVAPAFVAGASSAVWEIGPDTTKNPLNYTVSSNTPTGADGSAGAFNNNVVDLSNFGFDVADLREGFQIQKWMERNARSGARYVEFIYAHFGPTGYLDARLQRPEYIGGTKAPVIVSEVLQTQRTDTDQTPQGTMTGHGITVDSNFAGSYRVPEFGLIMGIMSVMPRADYQQGINRQWLHDTKYDFFFPEFQNLSEQAIIRAEIYASDIEGENRVLFGYQGKYDHMRTKQNIITGHMRSQATQNFDFWHLARDFDSAPALNQEFLECNGGIGSDLKRIYAIQDEDGLLINVANIVRAVRPLPIQSNPGMIDH